MFRLFPEWEIHPVLYQFPFSKPFAQFLPELAIQKAKYDRRFMESRKYLN